MNPIVEALHGSELIDIERIVQTASFAMRKMELPEDTEVSISFVSDEEIAELNEAYRGKEGPTDVLSFECDNLDDGFPSNEDAGEPYSLGDVIIALDVASRQAEEYGSSLAGEVDLLLVHGILHLCGYDHIEDADAEVMEPLQDSILAELRTSRGL